MNGRRPHGDGSLYWSEQRQRWVAEVTAGFDGRGKRVTRRLYRRTKNTDSDVPIEVTSRLVGRRGTTVTELVYRKQLRPVIQTGALAMDARFGVREA